MSEGESVRVSMAEVIAAARERNIVDVCVTSTGEVLWGRAKRFSPQRMTVVDVEQWLARCGIDADSPAWSRLEAYGYAVVDASDDEGRLRITITRRARKPELMVRLHGEEAPDFESLGWPREILSLIAKAQGILPIVGVEEAGKTTLASSLLRACAREDKLCWSLEMPAEYEQPASNVRVYSVGEDGDFPSWEYGVVAAMNSAVWVLQVGQVQDAATAQAVLAAARHGKLVIATIVSGNVAQGIEALLRFGCDAKELSERLVGGVALRLLTDLRDRDRLVGACELWTRDPESAACIARSDMRAFQERLNSGLSGWSLESNMERLMREGHVARAEALAAAVYPERL